MPFQDYKVVIDWLFAQFPAYQKIGASAYKPDLANIEQLLNLLRIDLNQVPYVHVAGTNGKGSTCSFIASALKEAGFNVGLFTSPHINDFRERIRINGEDIPEQDVLTFVQRLQETKIQIKPSFFEITLAMALDWFNKNRCDIAIIETGLGGRLDATNCITPILSIITNIGLEHQQFLGDTRDKIAFEKAGIIKKSIPVVIGQYDDEIAPVFESKAKECESEMYVVSSEKICYLEQNKELAWKALELLNGMGFSNKREHFFTGVLNVRKNAGLRARLEVISDNPKILMDAAHNPDGIRALLRHVGQSYPESKLHIVYGSSSDKDLNKIGSLLPKNAAFYLTQFSNQRSLNLEELQKFIEKNNLKGEVFSSPKLAMEAAKNAVNEEELILVFGSFFLLEDFF
jgi:dihydrofolate synthase / folylpolyglutamate synthase